MKKALSILFVASLMLLLAACGGTESNGAETGDGGERPTITLIENSWSASELNITVAKILLEEQLNYPVEVVNLDENAQWASIGSGDAHASLEVWPSGHADNIANYIDDQGIVENGGPLGPVGKIGWYIPTYMVEQESALASFEGFQNDALAALFATAETGEAGQFLGGDPSFVQYDADIINNLGMNLEVVYAGSEEAILAQLDSAYSREEPVLFYLWTPHAIHAQYDLTEVALPEYSDECYAAADSGGVDCDYPADELFKIFWSGLSDYAPEAYTLLSNMSYTTEDQIAMMADLELEGLSKEEAARNWIEANESVWQAWLP